MPDSPLSEESALFRELEHLAAQGRHRAVLDALQRLPAGVRESRTRPALLAAEAHGRLGEHEAAVRSAMLAERLARERGERFAEMRARNYQGLIALRHGDVEDAERHFSAALEMARALADHTTEARCLNNLGILANIKGDPESALASYRLAVAAYGFAFDLRGQPLSEGPLPRRARPVLARRGESGIDHSGFPGARDDYPAGREG